VWARGGLNGVKRRFPARAVTDAKISFEGLMTKKGGKQGTKGSADRWFVMMGTTSLDYYDPKKFGKVLGEIELTPKCQLKKGAKDKEGFHLDLTSSDGRTYFFMLQVSEKGVRLSLVYS
jgi:hypothetical protein